MTEHTLGTRPHDDAAAPGHAAAVRGVAARLGLVARGTRCTTCGGRSR